jgi:hypothetical protein
MKDKERLEAEDEIANQESRFADMEAAVTGLQAEVKASKGTYLT